MKNQFEQCKAIGGYVSVAKQQPRGLRKRISQTLAAMTLAWMAPVTAMAGDLLLNITDTGSDPSPAGAVIKYQVEVANSDVDSVVGGAVVFDLPLNSTLSKVTGLTGCTASSTNPVRVTCLLPEMKTDEPLTFGLEVDTSDISGATTQDVSLYGAVGYADQLNTITGPVEGIEPVFGQPTPPFYGDDVNANNNWQKEDTKLVRSTDLRMEKQGPSTIIGGGIATYTITVHNDGPSPSTGFTVVDALSGPTYVAGSFAGSNWAFNDATMTATYNGPAIPAGGSATFTLRAKVNAATGTVENLAVVEPSTDTSQPRESNPSNNNDTATTIVTAGADMTISKRLKAAPAVAGEKTTFQIQINNAGPSPALNPSWEDTLPAGFTLTTPLPVVPGWTCAALDSNTRIKCDYTGSLAVGAVVDFEFDALVPTSGSNSNGNVLNTAEVSSQTDDPDLSNNEGSVTFPVVSNGVDLALSKSKNPKLISVWDGNGDDSESRMTSRIEVLNDGPRDATDKVQVVDTLAAGEEYVEGGNTGEWLCTVAPSPWTQSGSNQVVTCDLDPSRYPLPPGQKTPELKIITRARAPNLDMKNEACTGGSGGSLVPGTSADNATIQFGDTDPTNNCAGDGTRTTLDRVDLEIAKRTNGPGSSDNVLLVNQNVLTYTLSVTNKQLTAGTSVRASGIIVSDTIPGYVAASDIGNVTVPGTTITAVTTPRNWPCTINEGSVICRSGTDGLDPGDSEDITITVTRPLFDSSVQTITGSCGVGAPATNAYCNTASVAVDPAVATSIAETITANNEAKDWVTIERQANMRTLSKAVSNNGVGQIGVNSEYKITYYNDGPSAVPAVIFRDVLTIPAGDPGFVLVSASRTGNGAKACTVDQVDPAINQNPNAGGGTSYGNPTGADLQMSIACTPLDMAHRQNEVMTVVIRPNRHPSAPAGRSFHDVGEFTISGGATGPTWNFNTDTSSADDTKTGELTFTQELATLVINKIDRGVEGEPNFGGVDPLGYDGLTPANNVLTYRISVNNLGPSVASNVTLDDTFRAPAGNKVEFIGMAGGTVAAPPVDAAYAVSNCTVVSGSPIFTGTGISPGDAGLQVNCNVPGAGFGANDALGVLNAGATSYVFMRYRYLDAPAASGDTVRNSVTTQADEAAPQSTSQETTVRTRVDLAVVKSVHTAVPAADPDTAVPATATEVTVWQPFYWVMNAVNNGPGASLSRDRSPTSQEQGTGTVITDTLPAGTELIGNVTWQKKGPLQNQTTPNGTGTCTVSGLKITCNVGDVTATGKVRVVAQVRHKTWPTGGKVKNVTEVATEQVDSVTSNNKDEEEISFARSSLAGVVYEDRLRTAGQGGNRQSATDEPGIEQVVVRLSGTDLYGNVLTSGSTGATVNYIEVKTSADGSFLFENLPPSDTAGYTVTQVQPAGYLDSPDTVPVAPAAGAASLGGTYNGSVIYSGITVGAKDVGIHYDFPEVRVPSLSGVVYVDVDRNNTYGGTDTLIDGAVVELLDASNPATVLDTRTTANGGAYKFENLDPFKVYTLREALPDGYANRPNAVNKGKIGGVLCAIGCTAGNGVSPDPATTSRISDIDLSSGQDGTEFNFGEDATTSLSGKVFLDSNDNNIVDSGELGIKDVIVTLYVLDANGTTYVQVGNTFTTSSNGEYLFTGLTVGETYRIVETQPNGLDDNTAEKNKAEPNVIIVPVLDPAGSSGHNFGEVAARISGRVYLDENNQNGYEAGEPGLPLIHLALTHADGSAVMDVFGNPVAAATSANDGTYRFDNLLAGDYTVTEVEQPTYQLRGVTVTTFNGRTDAGSVTAGTPGTASSQKTVPSTISSIALQAGANSPDNNFGEILPVSVSGVVFFDINNNGAQDAPNDLGIGSVDIRLTGTDDLGEAVDKTLATNADGTFNFEGLRPGTYTLIEPEQPTGTAQGQTTAGQLDSSSASSGTASNGASPESSKIATIDLTLPGDISSNNLFAEIPTNSGIMGKVWRDTDNDGVIDPGEKGIANVELELTGIDINGAPITPVTVTTDADGNYSFLNLPPGTYKVVEKQQPAGTHDGKTKPGNIGGTSMGNGSVEGSATAQNPSFIDTITVAVGQVSVDNNFGEIPVGSIAGFVYNDSNDDGIKQSGEGGFALVDVVLTGTDDLGNAINLTTKTDVNGHYVFENLRPGTYVVTEPTQPAETLNGLTTAGTIEGVRINAKTTGKETTPSVIDGIVLKPGNDSIDNNFGEIGDSPDMLVSKSSNTVKFTVNNVASYTIRVRNGGQQASKGEYTVKDRLPVGLNLAEVPSGNGWTCSGAVGGNRFECRSSEVLNAGVTSTSDITVKVNVTAEAAQAGTVNNAVLVEGGGENEFRTPTPAEEAAFEGDVTTLPVCDTAITQNVCRVPNEVQLAASVGGTVWFDIGSDDRRLDGGDERLQSWIVELIDSITGVVSQHTTTAVDGSYRFSDVVPGIRWNLQFRDPSSGVLWAWPVNQETAGGMGVACDSPRAITDSTTSACRVTENGTSQLQVVLEAGQHLPQQSLPVDPSGLVYDAVTRDPVPGSIVTLTPVGVCNGYDPMTAILNAAAGGYRVEGNAVSMTVGNNGYYQFMFGPAAPARCEFQLTVTPPGGYKFVSTLITPQDGSLSPLGDAGSSHLVQPQAGAPTGAVGTPTQYWLTLFAGSSTAGIVHNHIPLDTAEATGLVITKTGDRQTAEIGDTVQYTITVRQTAGSAMATLNIVDTLPRGFTYIDGTARVGGRALEEPFGKPGPRLGFNLGPINVGQQLALTYRVRVGVGAQQGDGINRAQAHGCSIDGGCIDPNTLTPVPGAVPSNRAEYRVRVTGGVFTEEACVLGKVFVDCNNNHLQDEEELGIPGVRLYFSNGTWVISDSEGKYSYCGLTPQSHTLKVDPSTLPAGSRLTTSSNRNLGDADSLFLDLKNGELHRADFIEGSCSNPLLEQVKARRTQGEVRAPETETGQSQLRFESKPSRAPQQATDSANQRPIVHPRPNPPSAAASQEVQP